MKMELNHNAIKAIQVIKGLFEESESEFNKLMIIERERVNEFHNEHASLNHCIRWGLQAATEILKEVAPETELEDDYEVAEDLTKYIDDNIEGIAESHLDAWKERYHRKSLESVVFDLRVNHDRSADIEYAEEQIGRELTDKEKDYFYEAFIKEVEETFYL